MPFMPPDVITIYVISVSAAGLVGALLCEWATHLLEPKKPRKKRDKRKKKPR